MTALLFEAFELGLRFRNWLIGIGCHPDPRKHFGPGGVDEAEAWCAEVGADLLAFIRPPEGLAADRVARLGPFPRRWTPPVERITFDSPLPSGCPPNDRVELGLYTPDSPERTGIVVLFHHPVYQSDWRPWEWFMADLCRRVPVAFMAAPYHFSRTPPGEFAGESVVNPNPRRLLEAIRQWSWDQQAAQTLLRESFGLRPAAVVGFSMGAFNTLLTASAGALPLPLVSIATTNRYAYGLSHGSLGRGVIAGMREVGIDRERLERMAESIQLERHVSRLRGRPVLLIAGRRDRVDPPPSIQRLEAALAPSRSVHLNAGHASLVFLRKRIASEIGAFLREVQVLPSEISDGRVSSAVTGTPR